MSMDDQPTRSRKKNLLINYLWMCAFALTSTARQQMVADAISSRNGGLVSNTPVTLPGTKRRTYLANQQARRSQRAYRQSQPMSVIAGRADNICST
jgi:hypothetical protein